MKHEEDAAVAAAQEALDEAEREGVEGWGGGGG